MRSSGVMKVAKGKGPTANSLTIKKVKMKVDVIQDMPSRYSSSEQWKLWHEALRKKFGRDRANNLWLEAWQRRGDDEANDEELRAYLLRQGISLDKDWRDAAIDFGSDVVGGVGDIFGSLRRNIMIVAMLILVVVAGLLYMIMKNPQIIQTAASLHPASKASNLLKR